jgi:hypothetical protein
MNIARTVKTKILNYKFKPALDDVLNIIDLKGNNYFAYSYLYVYWCKGIVLVEGTGEIVV